MWPSVKTAGCRIVSLLIVIFGCAGCSRSDTDPIKVIVPFAPGGGSDTLARVLVREIQEQPNNDAAWVIINVPGAGGTVGSRRVKNARPDGKTLLYLHDGILTAKYANQALYGPEAFTPIGMTGRLGMVICVAEESPFATLQDLMQEAAQAPESVTFAANIGAPSYFMARRLEQAHAGSAFRYVQSGGGARRFADLSGGHVAASAFSISEYLNFQEGGIRALAVLDENRHPSMPAVPSAIEEGYEISYSNLQGWWAPKGTPDDVVQELQRVLQTAIESPAMQVYAEQQCIDPVFLGSTELRDAMQQKGEALGGLELGFEREHLPPIELMLILCLMLGLALSFSGSARAQPESKTEVRPIHRLRHFGLAVILVGFIASLSIPVDMFLIAGIPFVLASGVLTLGTANIKSTAVIAVAAPVILFLFLSTLLGIDLP